VLQQQLYDHSNTAAAVRQQRYGSSGTAAAVRQQQYSSSGAAAADSQQATLSTWDEVKVTNCSSGRRKKNGANDAIMLKEQPNVPKTDIDSHY